MNLRRLLAEHPLPSLLTVAAVGATLWTATSLVTAGSTTTTIRLAALTTVLTVFAGGFWLGPAAEWYDARE
jgi:hypothetical protein